MYLLFLRLQLNVEDIRCLIHDFQKHKFFLKDCHFGFVGLITDDNTIRYKQFNNFIRWFFRCSKLFLTENKKFLDWLKTKTTHWDYQEDNVYEFIMICKYIKYNNRKDYKDFKSNDFLLHVTV